MRFTETSINDNEPLIVDGQVIPGAIIVHAGLVMIRARVGPSPSSRFAAVLSPDDDSARIRPPAPFQAWWDRPFLKDTSGVAITRGKLTRGVANKDGGAHIAPAVSEAYRRLGAGTGVPLQPAAGDSAPVHQFAMATMRQIAWELLDTFDRDIPHFLGNTSTSEWTAVERAVVSRNSACPCGSGRKVKVCHGS